ncbi:nuclear transport factor 2 family protein [Cellulomonas sp.]|uniref:nuclear transport factor 2 family protein n=1 Tax=Cellulomonas sp. TaxID=40001 RepID=UPI001B2E70EC|nr:nuclear transport factor 2 family protein [Cellulomonas sp.]MBO9556213.1 nuclear transport factor 2 family protein [Cellulomonas sp.]
MAETSELLDANLLQVFNNRDGAARRRAIDAVYAEDVTFIDPERTVTGRAALDERAAALLAGFPDDFEFVADGPRYIGTSTGALAWRLGPPGAAAVARGIDVITVRDGRISELRTMLAGED